ncbi:MAG TPA: class I SAM-dependent methyltransferase [Gemmatimonadales bacterium]|nr:class I SAM-dependent methyltransferase [Gemmatimonadales bacterium]
MTFYQNRIYPRLVRWLGNPGPILDLRRQIVPLAQGTVLEIGVGSGANFAHYDVGRITVLYALEPNPQMLQLAKMERRRTKLNVQFLAAPGERIPLDDGTVDAVVSTFTLCTIPAVVEAIRSIARVLKPGGKLIFLENCVAADPRVRRWQKWWEPIHLRVFAGLYLTRDIPALIAAGGFRIDRMTSLYLADFPKSWTSCCCGTAVRQP